VVRAIKRASQEEEVLLPTFAHLIYEVKLRVSSRALSRNFTLLVFQPVGARTYSSTYLPVVASGGPFGFDLAIEKAISSQPPSARCPSKRATCARAQRFKMRPVTPEVNSRS
jgi:hypothetical protein